MEMETLPEFLGRLFGEGRIAFRGAPTASATGEERSAAAGILRSAFAEELMELAGPPLAFDEATALAAAEWTRRACWFLVSRGEPAEAVDRALGEPPGPGDAAAHLAADLSFRYLPAVHRRARAIDPGDVLSRRLAEVLRRWPLSGALSDLEEPPESPIDFGGHEGLRLRYAERLIEHERRAWVPREGRGRALLALALDGAGRRGSAALGIDDDDDRDDLDAHHHEHAPPHGTGAGGADGGRG